MLAELLLTTKALRQEFLLPLYIKQELSKNLRLKKAPHIEFIADNYSEYYSHLEELFLKIKLKN